MPAKMRRVGPPILETPRLRLRPLEASDADALHAIQSDPEHMRFYPHPFSMDETRSWIERMRDRYEEVGYGLLAVEDRASGEFLGNVGPVGQRIDGIDEIELGWSITPRRAREGIATEAATACRGWVFGVLRADHVISLILPGNTPSSGVARKLGMTVWKQVEWGGLAQIHDVWRVDRER
ncbi:MAG TPA: GNAT family N-acetyltransferase [Actinomycetota bacterium]|nr:GNAT family N-acetyltransferase [Actinomycetota bacterium]